MNPSDPRGDIEPMWIREALSAPPGPAAPVSAPEPPPPPRRTGLLIAALIVAVVAAAGALFLQRSPDPQGQSALRAARAAYSQGDYAAAERALSQARSEADVTPAEVDALAHMVASGPSLDRLEALLAAKDWAAAGALSKAVLTDNPKNPRALELALQLAQGQTPAQVTAAPTAAAPASVAPAPVAPAPVAPAPVAVLAPPAAPASLAPVSAAPAPVRVAAAPKRVARRRTRPAYRPTRRAAPAPKAARPVPKPAPPAESELAEAAPTKRAAATTAAPAVALISAAPAAPVAVPSAAPAAPVTVASAPKPAPKPAAQPKTKGFLTVTASRPATVFVDGRSLKRRTPLWMYELPSGQHRVELRDANGTVLASRRLDVQPKQNTPVIFR